MTNHINNLTIWIKASLLMAVLLFSGNVNAEKSIGKVIHTNGGLTASNDGEIRSLKRGSYIAEGDTINSNSRSKSQLRMMDGALIVLRQNSEMHFEEYKYNEANKSSASSIFSLLKGGFKTISGLIGKHNKKNYKVRTAFTTIGIRGTDYGVTLCEQGNCSDGANGSLSDGLYASVIDGEISSENESGLYTFSNDEYFYIAEKNNKPQSLLKAPGVIFDPAIIEISEEEMNATNEHSNLLTDNSLDQGAVIQSNLESQNTAAYNNTFTPFFEAANDSSNNTYMVSSDPGDAMMFSYFQISPIGVNPISRTLVDDGTGNNQFTLNAIDADNGDYVPLAANIQVAGTTSGTLYIANATSNNVGSLNIGGTDISWGRWSGNLYETTEAGNVTEHSGSLHYAIADKGLTSPAQLSAMTGYFNYKTAGGTNATDQNGNVSASVADVNMAVDFGLQTIKSFSVATNVAETSYQAELVTPTAISGAMDSGLMLAGNPAGTCPTCGGIANLGFVGTQAEGAITSYNIGNASTTSTITGTAILTR